jgi:quinoprotein glucose dehydrogenase
MKRITYNLCLISFFLLYACKNKPQDAYTQWQVYGGGKENMHYSSLQQIDTGNVVQLKKTWVFHTGDADSLSQIQVNPLIIGDILYGVSPKLKLFAVQAATGSLLWTFDPAKPELTGPKGKQYFAINVCRGLAYYKGTADDERLFYSAGSWLYCIDATTGKPVASFGNNGKIDLHNDLGRDVKNMYIVSTTPGMIYKDMLIVGTRVAEDAQAAPGHIRAYDVHTGKLRWIFHTIPHPGEYGYDSWEDKELYKYAGGANAWAGFSLDEEKGIVFAQVGSASPDFYGGQRKGNNLYANCVLALDAATGKRIWHFQTMHHDVWDRDPPTAPVLVTLHKEGQKIEAIAQVTKTGFVFLLNRKTGEPVYPIEERPVPTESDLPGEQLSPTQPVPTVLPPFVRQSLQEADLNRLESDSSYNELKQRLASYKTGNMYHAPSRQGTVIFPGFDGGAEWGGPSFDPTTGWLYVNASEVPWILTMIDNNQSEEVKGTKESNLDAGKRLYTSLCVSCHGAQLEGGENFPPLVNLSARYAEAEFTALISAGRRMMPAFPQLSGGEKKALAAFLLNNKKEQALGYVDASTKTIPFYQTPYKATGYNKFLTREGYPAVAPPWGSLTAIDLSSGKIMWKDTLGDYPEFKARGIHTGTENYGGPVVTAGGLIFIAATRDAKFRAFNKRTGALLWETDLPAAGFATPAIYEVNGKQYVVIACGGGKLKQPSGDAYVAYALP